MKKSITIGVIVLSIFLVGVLLVSAAESKFGQVQKKRFGTNSVSGAAVSPMSGVTGAVVGDISSLNIEAEDFDTNGKPCLNCMDLPSTERIDYYDTTPANNIFAPQGNYRLGGADIFKGPAYSIRVSQDYALGEIFTDEYWNYTRNLPAGRYKFAIQYSAPEATKIRVVMECPLEIECQKKEFDGDLPATGGWSKFSTKYFSDTNNIYDHPGWNLKLSVKAIGALDKKLMFIDNYKLFLLPPIEKPVNNGGWENFIGPMQCNGENCEYKEQLKDAPKNSEWRLIQTYPSKNIYYCSTGKRNCEAGFELDVDNSAIVKRVYRESLSLVYYGSFFIHSTRRYNDGVEESDSVSGTWYIQHRPLGLPP